MLIHTLQRLSLLHQLMSIRKWRKTHPRSRFDTDFINRKPETLKIIRQQTKRVPGLSDKQTGTMNCHYLRQRTTQRGRFTGSGRPEKQQMCILGPVQLVQRIKGQHIPATVKETESGMPRTGFPSRHRQEPCQMLYPHQTRVPLFFIRIRIKTHGQRAQPAVQRSDIKLRAHWL
ncbi:hypothetical protein BvCmsNSP039_02772 [Escherichia coli]|nr:hypothetical protein BvCmsKKP062_05046 [Escherichia coli]GDQ35889.1 hypothetical protein BvCmsNSP039_02772 [Escherichia coli]